MANPRSVNPIFQGGIFTSATSALATPGTSYACVIFQGINGKTIQSLKAYFTASSSGVVDIKLETLSGYVPSGSLVAAGAELNGQSVAATTEYTFTLGTPFTVPSTGHNLYAFVIRLSSGTATARVRWGNASVVPRIVENVTGSPVQRTQVSALVPVYSDGSVQPGVLQGGTTALSTTSFTSGSNPDEYGSRFTAPFNCRIVGIRAASRINSGAEQRLRIYDANMNVLTVDAENTQVISDNSSNNTELLDSAFKDPVYLIGGKTYYATRAALNGNAIYNYNITLPTDATKDYFFGDAALVTRQNDTGAFTVDTAKAEVVIPLYDFAYGLNRDGMAGGMNS